jgi:hypothetical protein
MVLVIGSKPVLKFYWISKEEGGERWQEKDRRKERAKDLIESAAKKERSFRSIIP